MRTGKPSRRGIAARVESLETRQVMSADLWSSLVSGSSGGPSSTASALLNAAGASQTTVATASDGLPRLGHEVLEPDFRLAPEGDLDLEDQLQHIEQLLAEAHALTGWNTVQSNYGLTGKGQTIAVIDSGIAYDHAALGGGFGSNYRVVGGWDFTGENDGDPYDDGPSGSHGTHVAGIIGSSSTTHTGVASGVDLVSLRVFDDAGSGYFSWVENALRWVINNRNSFENPITAVNLSLGVSTWNASTPPTWANLEDEFQQLEQAGVFIAVSAGNSYTSFNEAGLSYPASSPYVVPVMSTDDSGLLSYFSQRHSRAIAAPGRGIVSTVPDYKGNNNGVTDDWGTKSGTSMAAPYVAGAAALIREAMAFAGQTNITQDAIFDLMKNTADTFFDTATNANYSRLNLWSAINSLMPADDYGSTLETAFAAGSLTEQSPLNLTGHIANLADVDVFSFTASATGTATFTASQLTNDLTSEWTVYNGQGQSLGASTSDELSFEVTAGQTYRVAYSTGAGIGRYAIQATLESSFAYTDWGTISFAQQSLTTGADQWFRVSASQTGWLTAAASYAAGGSPVSLHFYDGEMQLLAAQSGSGGAARADLQATAGGEYFLRILGANPDVDVTLANLVSVNGAAATIGGTSGFDAVAFTVGATPRFTVNGIEYAFGAGVNQFTFAGNGGNDALVFQGGSGDEVVVISAGSFSVNGGVYQFAASGLGAVTAYAGGGNDSARFEDTAGDDQFVAHPDRATITSGGFVGAAHGFDFAYAFATRGGHDRATFYDSSGDDLLRAYFDRTIMSGTGYFNYAGGFDETFAHSTQGGVDVARMYDSAGDDLYRTYPDRVIMSGPGFLNRASGFRETYGYDTLGGSDQAHMYDSAGDDVLHATPNQVTMSGAGYRNQTEGFRTTLSFATAGGFDVATLVDSAGNDIYNAGPGSASLSGGTYRHEVRNFDEVRALATEGGFDRAFFFDSPGAETFVTGPATSHLTGSGFYRSGDGFEFVVGYAVNGGDDEAHVYDSAADDVYEAGPGSVTMRSVDYHREARSFVRNYAYAVNGGRDRAILYDTSGDDVYTATPQSVVMLGATVRHQADQFEETLGFALRGGNDRADLFDSAGDDRLDGAGARITLSGTGFQNEARGFEHVRAYANLGGVDTLNVGAVDAVFESFGAWL